MLFLITGPLAGLIFRWNMAALLAAFAFGVIGDVVMISPMVLKTMPVVEAPMGLLGFVIGSALASTVSWLRNR